MTILAQPIRANALQAYPYSSVEQAKKNILTLPLEERITLTPNSEEREYNTYTVDGVIQVTETNSAREQRENLTLSKDQWLKRTVLFAFKAIQAMYITSLQNNPVKNEGTSLFLVLTGCIIYGKTWSVSLDCSYEKLHETACKVANLRADVFRKGFQYAVEHKLMSQGILHPQENAWLYEESLKDLFRYSTNITILSTPELQEDWIFTFCRNNPLAQEALASLDASTLSKLKSSPKAVLSKSIEQFAHLQALVKQKKGEKRKLTEKELSCFISEIQNISQSAKNSWATPTEKSLTQLKKSKVSLKTPNPRPYFVPSNIPFPPPPFFWKSLAESIKGEIGV